MEVSLMIIKNIKTLFFMSILFVLNSCAYLGYYRLDVDEKIINGTQEAISCVIPSVKVDNDDVLRLLDSILICDNLIQNKRKEYRNITIKEINSYLIFQMERSCKEKIEKAWGGFFYKGYFVCILKPMISVDNQVFEKQDCTIRIQGLLTTCSGYSEVPYSALFAKKEKDNFTIKYKTCEYLLGFDEVKKRADILNRDE